MRRRLRIMLAALAILVLLNTVALADAGPPTIIRQVDVQQALVALTFDDGPNPVYTPQILALLQQHHAHATFFVLGQRAEQYPELVRQAASQGNQIGIHGYHHKELVRMPPDKAEAEIETTARIIRELTGRPPTVYRPPNGAFKPDTVALVERLGYRFVLWTWATNPSDYRKPPAPTILRRVLRGMRPGAIVLLHDHGGDRRATVAAVGSILTELQAQGYQFVTLDALLEAATPP